MKSIAMLPVLLAVLVAAGRAEADDAATPPHARPLVVLDAGHGGSNTGAPGTLRGAYN